MAYTMCQRGLNVVVPLWHHRPLIIIIAQKSSAKHTETFLQVLRCFWLIYTIICLIYYIGNLLYVVRCFIWQIYAIICLTYYTYYIENFLFDLHCFFGKVKQEFVLYIIWEIFYLFCISFFDYFKPLICSG